MPVNQQSHKEKKILGIVEFHTKYEKYEIQYIPDITNLENGRSISKLTSGSETIILYRVSEKKTNSRKISRTSRKNLLKSYVSKKH